MFNRKGAWMLIRRGMDIGERREIMAHELKHYFADEANDLFQFSRKEYNKRERPAAVFAACLLVPDFLLKQTPTRYSHLTIAWSASDW